MGPIELLYIAIGLVITLIGLARGYVRELGNTVIALSAIFLLTFFQDEFVTVMTQLATDIFGIQKQESIDGFLSAFFTLAFVSIIFASYAGRTLDFSGTPAPPPGGTLLSLGVGALNGYLIAGTLWYYQDEFGYPLRDISNFQPPLSHQAQIMVQYLPPRLFDSPVYWIIPVVILLILFVRN